MKREKSELKRSQGSVIKMKARQICSISCSINLSSTIEIHGSMMIHFLSLAGSILRVSLLFPVCDDSLAAFLIPHTTLDLYNFIIN